MMQKRTVKTRATDSASVLVADLVRGWPTLLGIEFLTFLFYRDPMTRSDALTSFRLRCRVSMRFFSA